MQKIENLLKSNNMSKSKQLVQWFHNHHIMVAFKTSSQLFQFGINTILYHELDLHNFTHCDLAT
jgi:hypothetical protein